MMSKVNSNCRRSWKQICLVISLIIITALLIVFGGHISLSGSTEYSGVFSRLVNFVTASDCPQHIDFDTVWKLSENPHLAQVPSCKPPSSMNTPYNGDAAKVVLITYQRSGSTFLGELFDRNPDGFYMFEPIDGVYTAMYGTGYGWNVPDHIMSDDNGNMRNYSSEEIEYVATTIQSILTCNFNQTPIQVLAHKFQTGRTSSLKLYKQCLVEHKVISMSRGCRRFLDEICPRNFYPGTGVDFCHDGIFGKLNFKKLHLFKTKYNHTMSYEDIENKFRDYNQCFREVKQTASKCIRLLESMCRNTSVHGIKTVRVGMEVAIHLLKYTPDLKIIHNIRDPRAISLSRRRINSGDMMSITTHNDIVKEAKIICNTIGRHIKLQKALEKLRPGTSMQNIYEQFAQNPLKKAEEIYKFIGHKLPEEVKNWLKVNALGQTDGKSKPRNSSLISLAWEDRITLSKSKQIDEFCKTVYEEIYRKN